MSSSGPALSVRAAGIDDATVIAALASQLGYPTTPAQAAARLSQLLQMPDHDVLLAEQEEKVLGWAHVERRLNLESDERAELMGLVVDAQCRRIGVGRKLVEAVESWAASRQIAVMVVRSNVTREASHAFYRQLGYAAVKTQHVYQKSMSPRAHRA